MIAGLAQIRMHALGGADIQSARRIDRGQRLHFGSQFASQHDFLLVAARQSRNRRADRGRADVVPLDALAREAVARLGPQPAPFRKRRMGEGFEDQIVGQGKGPDQPLALSVAGHKGQASPRPLGRTQVGGVGAVEPDLARARAFGAREDFRQFGLAVAFDSGDGMDFARARLERQFARPAPSGGGDLPQRKDRFARRLAPCFRRPLAQRMPDHPFAQLARAGAARLANADRFSGAQNGDPIAYARHFVQFVRNEDDRAARGAQRAHCLEQIVDFGWGQNGRRFVQNQRARAADQRLEQFDALLLADGQRLDALCRVDPDMEAFGGGGRRGKGLAFAKPGAAQAGDAHAQEQVFGDGQSGREHEMLVHHADAQRHGFGGRMDPRRRAEDFDFAGVHPEHPEQDVHQRGFAGAVFSQQGVDFALGQLEMDAAQRLHGAEGFSYAFQDDGGGKARSARRNRLVFRHESSAPGESAGNRPLGDCRPYGVPRALTSSSPERIRAFSRSTKSNALWGIRPRSFSLIAR
ncbi:MAG: hypothetical protein BWZ10_01827 [candidate division BRC1 bacterium ADurb.BinA364]|nr:MAG: hypothetical protein BWZ10_01827 [candidate division BRC1 bacterium ADurb.BinA364]